MVEEPRQRGGLQPSVQVTSLAQVSTEAMAVVRPHSWESTEAGKHSWETEPQDSDEEPDPTTSAKVAAKFFLDILLDLYFFCIVGTIAMRFVLLRQSSRNGRGL